MDSNNNQPQITSISTNPAQRSSFQQPSPKKTPVAPIIAIVCAVLAIGAIVFGVIEFVDANQKTAEIASLQSNCSSAAKDSASQTNCVTGVVTDSTDTDVREIVDVLYGVAETFPSAFYKTYDDQHGESYIQDGVDSIVFTNKMYGLIPYDSEAIQTEDFMSALSGKLKELGFKEVPELEYVNAFTPPNIHFLNDNGIICAVYDTTANCSHVSWNSLDDEKIALINELVEAYSANDIYDMSTPYRFSAVSPDLIQDSQVSPYQTISISCWNGYCKFYRISPDSQWQFAFGGNGGVSCDEVNTDDLKNAFAGDVCYDDTVGDNVTIQPAN